MKNLSLILNAVLILAVGVLYYLHFHPQDAMTRESPQAEITESTARTYGRIAFINIDTLLNNYDYYADLQDELMDKQSEMEAELNSRSQRYQTSALDYQDKLQKGLVTRSEAARLEEQLIQEQQNLIQFRDELSSQLAEEEQVRNRRLINAIMEYLKDYNTDYNYEFIFSNSFGDNMLFADDELDITYSVLGGLNAQYRTEKGSTP